MENELNLKGSFVDGKWFDEGKSLSIINPATGQALSEVKIVSKNILEQAITGAKKAQKEWAKINIKDRAKKILQLCDIAEKNLEKYAKIDCYNVGNTIRFARNDIKSAIKNVKYFCDHVDEIKEETFSNKINHSNITKYQPYGIVLKINAFNRPFRWCLEKLAAPLLMGNAIIIKNSEQAPLSALKFSEVIKDVLPDGLVSIICGDHEVGDYLVRHPDIGRIAGICSVETGIKINEAASSLLKKVSLELGGKNPLIAFSDADPEKIVEVTLKGMRFDAKGESCTSPTRVFIHKSLKKKYLEILKEKIEKLKIGLPWEEDTDVGPVVSKKQYDTIKSFIDGAIQEGAELYTGGYDIKDQKLKDGFFIKPTVLNNVTQNMTVANEEIFGPVVSVLEWDDEEEVIKMANSVKYGLTGYIVTNDMDKAKNVADQIESGYIWVNAAGRYPGAPFGGWKLSGIGVEECLDEMKSYGRIKNINMEW